jgi:hypothetical protein
MEEERWNISGVLLLLSQITVELGYKESTMNVAIICLSPIARQKEKVYRTTAQEQKHGSWH